MTAKELIASGALLECKKLFEGIDFDDPESIRSKRQKYTPVGLEGFQTQNQLTMIDHHGYPVVTISPETEQSSKAIMWIHGGVYFYDMDALHVDFCDRLVSALGIKAYLPLYPLLPEGNAEDAYDFLLKIYSELVEKYENVILAGDSCGGTMALGLLEMIGYFGIPRPNKMILSSPFLDAALNDPDVVKQEEKDMILSRSVCVDAAERWADMTKMDSPNISPIYGSYIHFPETLIFTGSEELFYPDISKYYEALREKEQPVLLEIGEGCFHDYPLYHIDEGETAVQKIIDFITVDELSEEEEAILDQINATKKEYPFTTILEAFFAQTESCGDRPAVRCGDVTLTYKEVHGLSNALALKLIENQVGKGDRVALVLSPSEWMPIGVLGILKTGASYIPMDKVYPDEWKQQVISDAGAKIIVTDHSDTELWMGEHTVIDLTQLIPADTYENADIVLKEEAAVIFTSGSTGTPKGVRLAHKGITNLCSWFADFVALAPDDRVAMYQNFAFVSHIEPMFSPFFVGACTDIVPEKLRLDMHLLNEYYVDHQISISKMGASAGRQFMAQISDTSLRVLYLSGEKLGQIDLPKSYRVIDAYGPTENTAQITAIDVEKKSESSSVGFPIDNVKVYVLDSLMRRCPIGTVGRLYVTGAGLSLGYLNRPELNEKVFVSNPYSVGDDDKILYDTGDYVRILETGEIDFVGRRDDQIKIHGCRVELSEVASVIENLDEISRCICVAIPTEDGLDNAIAAYITVGEGVLREPDQIVSAVKKAVADAKPKYMIPAFVIPMATFPLTLNGKVYKKKLPKPDRSGMQKAYIAPRTEEEQKLCTEFEKIFQLEKIGIDDDFIDLGGDSLQAIMLLSDLEDFSITAADVLRHRTPRKIAFCAEKQDVDFLKDNPYTYETGFPFSTFQMAVYNEVHSREEKDNELMPVIIDLPESVSLEQILETLDKLIIIHPIIRAYCDESEGFPMNRMGDYPQIIHCDEKDEDIINRFKTETFNYHKSMSRYLIIKKTTGYRVYAEFHHMISDITSQAVFKRHFMAVLKGEDYPVDTGMLKQAAFEDSLAGSSLYEEAGRFFAKIFEPVRRCKPMICETLAEKPGNLFKYYDLDRQALAHFTQKHYTSLGAFYTAVFGLCFAQTAQTDCAAFLTAENDRDRLHLHESFGAFTKLIPILIDCRHDNVKDFMSHATETFYDLCNYDFYSLQTLYETYPLTNAVYQDFLPITLSGTKLGDDPDYKDSYVLLNGEDEIAQTDFYCNIMETARGFAFFVEHSEIYTREWVEAFCDCFYKMVKTIVETETMLVME